LAKVYLEEWEFTWYRWKQLQEVRLFIERDFQTKQNHQAHFYINKSFYFHKWCAYLLKFKLTLGLLLYDEL
jgi:hypothetical protein